MMRFFNRQCQYAPPRSKSIWWISAFVLAVLAVVAILLGSQSWERDRLLDEAQASLDGGDVEGAAIYLGAAYEADPQNTRTLSLLVELFEQSDHPFVMHWDERLLQQVPGSEPDRLRAAKHAMEFDQPETALQLLAEMPESGSESPGYSRLMAAASAAGGSEFAEIRKHLKRATEEQPGEQTLDALNLVVFDALASPPASPQRQAAMAQLKQLAAGGAGVSPWALLMLVKLEAPNDGDRGAEGAQRGASNPHLERLIGLVDEHTHLRYALLALDAAHAYGGDGWREMLARVRAQADGLAAPQATFWTMDWMNRHGLFEASIAWADAEAAAKARAFPVCLAVAEAYLGLHRWEELGTFLDGQRWPGMDSLRLAMAAISAAQTAERPGRSQIANLLQEQAIERASRSEAELRLLEFAARKHQWDDLHEQVLWKIARSRKVSREVALSACARLKRRYLASGNLEKSLQVAERSVEIMPSDFIESNNLIYTSLLMRKDVEQQLARSLALHQRYPGIRPITSTCALAHLISGDVARARALLHELPEPFRRHPAIAPFCGVVLAHAGETQAANAYLQLPAVLHFDAERELVATAKGL